MRTQIIPENALGLPWLEHFPVKGGPPEQAILDKSPFIIGRGDSADLQVVSHGVSREHASVVNEGRATRIRDLGSTNGTFVNGQRIKDAELHDGDMVQVANVELVFYCGKAQARQTMVTQVLPSDADADSNEDCSDPAGDLRRSVRRLHETLVSGCVKGRLKPIVDLRLGQPAGYEPWDEDLPPAGPGNNSPSSAIPGRVAARLRHLRRMRGVEQAMGMPGKPFIFMNFQPAEAAAGKFLELASMFCELLPDPKQLVIAVPCAAAKDIVQVLSPAGRLRELGVAVALSDFGGKDAGTGAPGGDTSRVYPPSRSAGPRYCGECGEHAGNSGNHPGRRRERNEGDCRGNRQSCGTRLMPGSRLPTGPGRSFRGTETGRSSLTEGQSRRIAACARFVLLVPCVGFDRAFVRTLNNIGSRPKAGPTETHTFPY